MSDILAVVLLVYLFSRGLSYMLIADRIRFTTMNRAWNAGIAGSLALWVFVEWMVA